MFVIHRVLSGRRRGVPGFGLLMAARGRAVPGGATRLGPGPSRPAREKSCAHRECGATMGMILRPAPVTVQRSIFQRVTVVTELDKARQDDDGTITR
ncbi:hypothetical protein BSLA_01r4379 [Burkholderia stabilis]|nr:hypothetical protein BSLA_01r4379 [Burkholderia stabilis]